MNRSMLTRIMTAVIALCVLSPFLLFSHTFMLIIFSAVLSVVALYEMLGCIGWRKKWYICLPIYLISTLVMCMARVLPDKGRFFTLFFSLMFTYLVFLLTIAVISHGEFKISDAASVFGVCTYIIFGFASIILLRDLKYGQFMYLLAFLVPWISDSFAYFFGVRFGKHKLMPDVSPKKTVEGSVAGLVFGTLSVIFYGFIVGTIFEASPRYPALIIAGIVMSFISQCGDLIASLIKREHQVKDYGFVLPGHGGIMDRFDSIIVTAPFLYMLCILSTFFELFF